MFRPFTRRKLTRLWLVVAAIPCWGQSPEPTGASFKDQSFDFFHEFYGPRAFTNPEAVANFRNRMANGVSLQPPIDSGFVEFVRSRAIHVMVDPAVRSKNEFSLSTLTAQQQTIEDLARTAGIQKVLWNLMPEWDQSGGSWLPEGRPRYTGQTREQAYSRFLDYYATNYAHVQTQFSQAAFARPYWLASITDHPANTFYAYEGGADLCLLERSIDELGDLSTGIAFVRGAARQNDRQWGIDVSTFRTSNNMATRFDSQEVLLGGWSPSYLKRHYYITFMAGAHVLRNEATSYYKSAVQLDPFGRMTQDFADFALNRHSDVGRPVVTTALLMDHYSGFDPKHWIYNQLDAVWYQDIPYSDGDRMINNFFRLAYPNHWLHGLTPGAPFNDASGKADARGFQTYLARGGDPRPYEPMGTTRYGQSIDVITDRAAAETLRNYKVIILLGDVRIGNQLRDALISWVREGGTLVASVNQQTGFDESFLGVRIGRGRRRETVSTWRADGAGYRDSTGFTYTPVSATTATVLASSGPWIPLVTSNSVGGGRVIFSAVPYLQNALNDRFLTIGTRLFDWLAEQTSAASIEGLPVDYIVNQALSRVLVTVVNNSGQEWTGTVLVPAAGDVVSVREYISDQDARWTSSSGTVRVAGQVPAYDVKVYVVEFAAP
jgi:hypothetical protein